MAAVSMPFMSDGVVGAMTFSPGMWVKFENRLLECCAPCPQPRPMMVRTTSGTLSLPPVE